MLPFGLHGHVRPFLTVYHYLRAKATPTQHLPHKFHIHIVQKDPSGRGFEKKYLQTAYFRVKYMLYNYGIEMPWNIFSKNRSFI